MVFFSVALLVSCVSSTLLCVSFVTSFLGASPASTLLQLCFSVALLHLYVVSVLCCPSFVLPCFRVVVFSLLSFVTVPNLICFSFALLCFAVPLQIPRLPGRIPVFAFALFWCVSIRSQFVSVCANSVLFHCCFNLIVLLLFSFSSV